VAPFCCTSHINSNTTQFGQYFLFVRKLINKYANDLYRAEELIRDVIRFFGF